MRKTGKVGSALTQVEPFLKTESDELFSDLMVREFGEQFAPPRQESPYGDNTELMSEKENHKLLQALVREKEKRRDMESFMHKVIRENQRLLAKLLASVKASDLKSLLHIQSQVIEKLLGDQAKEHEEGKSLFEFDKLTAILTRAEKAVQTDPFQPADQSAKPNHCGSRTSARSSPGAPPGRDAVAETGRCCSSAGPRRYADQSSSDWTETTSASLTPG